MKSLFNLLGLPILVLLAWSPAPPEPLASSSPSAPSQGSPWTTGADGRLGVGFFGPGEHTINLGAEGDYDAEHWWVVLDYTSLTIQPGANVRFVNHPTRAPVVIRAQGPITIAGNLILDGQVGHSTAEHPTNAESGPGGFRGGTGANSHMTVASAGHGPGGGYRISSGVNLSGGRGSHATPGEPASSPPGPTYGSPYGIPLIGGSGGAGGGGASGGGGGGGAILIGSDTSIQLTGSVLARGGASGNHPTSNSRGGAGSGGTIRLASPVISGEGGILDVSGGGSPGQAGYGYVRIESNGGAPGITSTPPASIGALEPFLPTGLPSVHIIAWWNAGQGTWVLINQDPRGSLGGGAADAHFPTTGVQILKIEGRNIELGAPLYLRKTHTRGLTAPPDPIYFMGSSTGPISGEPSTYPLSWTDVEVDFSLGVTTVQVRAWLP